MAVKFSNLTQIDKDVDNIKTNMGNIKDINTIGDGTVSGAIKELHNTSTKGIRITQEEYDKLTDEQKQGVYFIVDAKDVASDFAEKFHEYSSTITDIANKVGNEDLGNIGSISSALSKLDGVIANSDKLIYGEKSNEIEDIGLQTDADLLGGELPSYYASKYDISDINTKIDELSNAVKNINHGKVFETEIEMNVWLRNGNNKHQLTVGDSLFIKEKDKPDYWVSAVYDNADVVTGMFYEVTEMESEKVDLSDYDAKIGNVDINGIGNGSITGAIYFLENERAKLFQSVSDGKKAVANAITGKGVPTAEDAQFATLVNNIRNIKNTPTLQAKTVTVGYNPITVTPDSGYDGLSTVTARVISQEKTLTIKSDSYTIVPDSGKVLSQVIINGPTNRGAWHSDTTGSGNVTIPEGYHNGSGYVSGSGAYNAGYNSGYSAGSSSGYNDGVSATKKGNAGTGDVLSGKTFTNSSSVEATGTMPNQGAWTGSTTGSGNVSIPAGYHNGSGYVSGQGAYNAGYSAGYSAGQVNYDDTSLIVQGRLVYSDSTSSHAATTGVTGEYTIPKTSYYYFKASASFNNSNACTNDGTKSINVKVQKYNSSTGAWDDFLTGAKTWDKIKVDADTQVRFYFYGFDCTSCNDAHSGSRSVKIYNCAAPVF